jgi:hypothetical protein
MGEFFIAATSARNLPVDKSRHTIDALPVAAISEWKHQSLKQTPAAGGRFRPIWQ